MPDHQQTHHSTESKSTVKRQAPPTKQTPISNPMAIIQRARINPKSLTHADVMQLQRTIGNRAVGKLLSEIGLIPSAAKPVQRQEIPEEENACPSCVQRQEIPDEEEPLQGKMLGTIQRQEIPEEKGHLQGKMAETIQRQEIPEDEEPLQGKFVESIQRQEIPEDEEPLQGKFEKSEQKACPTRSTPFIQKQEENHTGMPDNLKTGVESLSGINMSDVRVHYNSDKPAGVGALAYTQGTDIHVAPGQERHLPHEAWHVVQQAQCRVKPTMRLKDVAVNDDEGLEHEADEMGERAILSDALNESSASLNIVQRKLAHTQSVARIIQLRATIEIQNSNIPSEKADGVSDANDLTMKLIDAHNHNNVLMFTKEKIPNQDIFDPNGQMTERQRSRYKCAEPNALGNIMAGYHDKVGSKWLYDLKFTNEAYIEGVGNRPPCPVCKQWVTNLKIDHRIIKPNIKSIEEEKEEASSILTKYNTQDPDKNPAINDINFATNVLRNVQNPIKRLKSAEDSITAISGHISAIDSALKTIPSQRSDEIQRLLNFLINLKSELTILRDKLENSPEVKAARGKTKEVGFNMWAAKAEDRKAAAQVPAKK